MTPVEPRWRGAQAPSLSWEDGVPRSERFSDSYFSQAGGADESRHVFIDGNAPDPGWVDGICAAAAHGNVAPSVASTITANASVFPIH